MRERDVLALHVAPREVADERGLRLDRARDDHRAARVLVEPMHDARARDAREFRVAVQQRVEQRAVAVAGARVHDEPGRLVDHDHGVVLVQDRERQRLRLVGERGAGRVGHEHDAFPAGELALRRGRRAVDADAAVVDPRLQAAAGVLGQEARERLVEAQPGAFRRDDERHGGSGRGGVASLGWAILSRLQDRIHRWSPDSSARSLGVAFLAAFLAAGCGLLPERGDETVGWSAERLYRTAHDSMLEGNYTRAVKLFETLEARFPYGRYAQQAMLESAFASYRANETATAVSTLDRFIRTYPNHANADYAHYLKGLVHFREDQGLFGYVYEFDLSERDPKLMKESFAAFKQLNEKFPDSRYVEDSKARLVYLSNALSMFEVHVARYYYNRAAFVAAASRAQSSLVNYPRTAGERARARRADPLVRQARPDAARGRLAPDPGEHLPAKRLPDRRARRVASLVEVLGAGRLPRRRRRRRRRQGRRHQALVPVLVSPSRSATGARRFRGTRGPRACPSLVPSPSLPPDRSLR